MPAVREMVGADVDYDDELGGDDFFTAQGRDDERDEGDDWNSESDTVGQGQDAEDIQARPVSSLGPKDKFFILQRWWFNDADYTAEWRRQATEDFGFVAGEQLTLEDKELLDAAQRPHVVFNRVLTVLKAVAGMEINGRHEIQFLPEENDDTVISEVLSGTSKWMGQRCDAEDEQSSAFQQSSITGIGVTEARFSYERKSNGEYIEEMFDCREFGWDRTARKKNLADARRMWRVRRMPLSDAMQMFPNKTRRQLDASWADIGIYMDAGPRSIEEKRIRDGKNSYLDWDDTNEVTIVHMQWMEREPYYLVADEQTNTKMELSPREYRLLSRRMILLGMQKPEAVRLTRQVYKQAFLGNEYLGGGDAPLGQQFSWAVITGEWDAKKRQWFGLTRVLRDPQMWANKFMSQVMHIMNSTAKGGLLAEVDAFDDQIEAEESYAMSDAITWLKTGALSNGKNPKVMPKPGQGDASAYVNLLQYSVSAIKDVTGINAELLGQQDMQNPGVVESMRKQAGMTVLATLFDALRRYRKIVGRQRLYIIQTRLSDGRIIRIVGQQYSGAVQLAKSMVAGEYDVVVDDAPTSPNQKEANWAIIQPMLAVFKDQLMSQPDVFAMVLEYSPLPSQLVAAIKRAITQKQSDPTAQAEQQKIKELTFAKLLSEVSKNDSIANMNNAKAGTATQQAAYDIAIAQNMEHDNALERGKLVIDAKKADADAELTRVKAAREAAGIHHDAASSATDILNARTKHLETVGRLHADRFQMHSDRVGALAGAHHDLASALHKRVQAHHLAATPVVDPNAQAASGE